MLFASACAAAARFAAGLLAMAGAGTAGAQSAQWTLLIGGVSHHFQQTRAAGREWQEQHPGLGFERRTEAFFDDRGDWMLSSIGGVMQDSRGVWSGYAGLAALHQWQRNGLPDLGLGLGAFAFYRSISWSGTRALVPGMAPMASAHFPATDLTLNLVYVPRIPAYDEAMPAVLHLQLGYRFR